VSNIKEDGEGSSPVTQDRRIQDAVRFLEENPDQPIGAVAKILGLSRWRLSHIASDNLGRDLRAWKRELQLTRACHLLAETNLSVKEIRWRCGIADGSNFSHAFRQRFGVSPSAYREGARRVIRERVTATSTNK
jgi:AraC-like DNA-binding protein